MRLCTGTLGKGTMMAKRIEDWTTLPEFTSSSGFNGLVTCSGTVECVANDGTILWIQPAPGLRKLYGKAAGCQAWPTDDSPGFLYWASKFASDSD